MDKNELEELRLDLKSNAPNLYWRMIEGEDDCSVRREIEDWIGREPYMWDYREFVEFCAAQEF